MLPTDTASMAVAASVVGLLDEYLVEVRRDHEVPVTPYHYSQSDLERTMARVEGFFSALEIPWEGPDGTEDFVTWELYTDLGPVGVALSPDLDSLRLIAVGALLGDARDSAGYLFKLLEANLAATGGAHFCTSSADDGVDIVTCAHLTASTADLEEVEFALLGILRLLRLVRPSPYDEMRGDVSEAPPLAPSTADPASPNGVIPTTTSRGETASGEAGPSFEELMTRLNALVGLAPVKEQVTTIANLIRVQQLRAERGLTKAPVTHHSVFVGPPGTGKTTVARLLAQVFRALGLVERGHLREAARQDLVAEYVGQTAVKTNKVIDEALGGVLFVDEAYALAPEDGGRDYGREAIETLLKRMEDDRDKFVVIVAGYEDEMERLLQSNPGLRSRFTTTVAFPSYEPHELREIFGRLAADTSYRLTDAAEHRAAKALTQAWRARGRHFGNARMVRNLFEDSVARQANRIASRDPDNDVLSLLEEEDIPLVAG